MSGVTQVHRLYESGLYMDVVQILMPTLHQPQPKTKVQSHCRLQHRSQTSSNANSFAFLFAFLFEPIRVFVRTFSRSCSNSFTFKIVCVWSLHLLHWLHYFEFTSILRVIDARVITESFLCVCAKQASELGMSIPERPAQLLLLQDSLIKLKDYEVWFVERARYARRTYDPNFSQNLPFL